MNEAPFLWGRVGCRMSLSKQLVAKAARKLLGLDAERLRFLQGNSLLEERGSFLEGSEL